MSAPWSRPSQLGCLVDLAAQLQRDADRPEADLHRRDRALVRELPSPAPRDRRALLLGWLDALRAKGEPLPGRAVAAAYRLNLLGLVLLGLLIGWGTTATIFYYDGTRPVNAVNVLAVFVGAQILLLVLLGVVMLPHRLTRHLPGLSALQETLAWLSPGQATRWAIKRLPQNVRDFLAGGIERGAGLWTIGNVQKWAVLFAAQSFAVAFNLGALVAAVYLVTFSDLAFAWSTTLEPDVATAHRVTQWLAAPWAWLVPQAVPSSELVRETLYYRQSGPPPGMSPARWGEWWPFLVACMLVYGLLPRLLLLFLAGRRLRRALNRALAETPGAALVIDRLTSALVITQSPDTEPEPVSGPDPTRAAPVASESLGSGPLCLINWGGVEISDDLLQERFAHAWHRPIPSVQHAGGRRSVDEDLETVAAAAALPPPTGAAIVVKSWEPPMLEVADFIRDLRQALGRDRIIVVAPVRLDPAGELAAPAETELRQWQKQMRHLGDPGVVVRPWQEGVAW